ncbi:FAD-dependent monooxygenase DEP4 [Lachnellula arida]|uniref:FAD-dependent monooxygenase DEP4 n=1 Tax=Lachnellula arida TaxID=1316785 RepID=A0A8T9BDZ8_9HELO|nr:FAD-dependent monooxygenase DEP4 [Lachnellula arida]
MAGKDAEIFDVVIIGAGWYGLVAAKTYLKLRPKTRLKIIDADNTVGGVWSKERLYPNLVAQVKHGLFNYTDTPMPRTGATTENMVTGDMIHSYLQTYAESHGLLPRIRFNTFVEHAERCERGWRLSFKDSDDIIETEKLLVATGVTSIASMPDCPAENATVPIVHSKDLGMSYGALQNKDIRHVVVVGAAKSAYDAVYLMLSMNKEVTWIIRPDGAGPLAILPTEIFGIFNSIAVASTRLMTYLSPSISNTDGALYHFFQKSRVGRWCTNKFWDTITFMSNRHAGYSQADHVSQLKPEVASQSVFWANSGLGVVTLPNFWDVIHKGKVRVLRDGLSSINECKVNLASGKSVDTDYVIMCTGWGNHFGMFDHETKLDIGLPSVEASSNSTHTSTEWDKLDREANKAVDRKLPNLATPPTLANPQRNDSQSQRKWRLYRRAIPFNYALRNDRSLAILGQIHTVQTPLVSEMQSFWAILYLLGELDTPDEETMANEIAEWNAWTRKRYLNQGLKFPYSLYDFLSYVDTLCKDLGINSHRKSNPVAELFSPYKPEDFDGFIDEYLCSHKGASS